jgi:2-haloalkanoic acid dehalogenase type II
VDTRRSLRRADFAVLTFDCYGTLIDWEAGLAAVLEPWAARRGIEASRDALLEAFGRHEARLERERPRTRYSDLLRAVHESLAGEWRVRPERAEADRLAHSVGDWPAFADTRAALARLAERHRLVVVSNVDRASFARTRERLGVELDAVITAEDAGAYKPDPAPFKLALETVAGWGIDARRVLHVAQSLYPDLAPAKALGLRTVWVDRRRGRPGAGATPPPPDGARADLVVASLAELATTA